MRSEKRGWKKRVLFNIKFYKIERRKTKNFILLILMSVLFFFFFRTFVISTGIIDGDSMYPTLKHGDVYLTNKYVYKFNVIQRGDIIVLKEAKYSSIQLVKRIIGLPGETIEIREKKVYINDEVLNEPYISGKTWPDMNPYLIGKDCYFVMGDNRCFSEDSREFGTVALENIEGRIKPGELFAFK